MSVWSGLVNLDGNLALLPRFAYDSENFVYFLFFIVLVLIDFLVFHYKTLIFVILQAVMNGFWVVFEGIDKAPSDVQSILLPLLEGASSFLTGHGEVSHPLASNLFCCTFLTWENTRPMTICVNGS